MRIVAQSVPLFYSPFLALPAPQIAGLLPAPKPETPPPPLTFTYTDARLGELTDVQRETIFVAMTLLLDVGLEYQAGTLSDRALNAALTGFRKAVGGAFRPMNPTQYAAECDVPLLEFLMEVRRGAL
jgi:hypothetical protein